MQIIWNLEDNIPLSIRDNTLRADWVNIGESLTGGEYKRGTPKYMNALRFDVYKKPEWALDLDETNSIWEILEDGSYCTMMPATVSPQILEASLRHIISQYRMAIESEGEISIRATAAKLSWLSEEDFAGNIPHGEAGIPEEGVRK